MRINSVGEKDRSGNRFLRLDDCMVAWVAGDICVHTRDAILRVG